MWTWKKNNDERVRRKIVKIHNKYYDVTNFNHPGGPIAIMAANRRDATALFESHHPFSDRDMMDNVLKKYEIHEEREKCEKYLLPGENENGDNNLFNWDETLNSEFTLELRDKVKKHFKYQAEERGVSLIEATKATPQRWCEWGAMATATMWSFYTMLYSQSIFWSWLNVLLCPAIYWMSAGMFHDGSHFAVSRDWRINWGIQHMYNMCRVFSSPYNWLHQHIIGHHMYTNIHNKDPDLNHENNLTNDIKDVAIRYIKNTKWTTKHINQENRFFQTVSFGLLSLIIVNPLVLTVTNLYNKCMYKIPTQIKYSILYFIEILLTTYVIFILPFQIWSPFYVVKHVIIPFFLVSTIFNITASANHLHKDSITGQNKNWYIHQVTTSNNFGSHWPHYYTSIGLNYQIEHHLFPTVNHCHLRDIQPIVKKLCAKHGIPYHHTSGYKEAIMGVYEHIREMGREPAPTVETPDTRETPLEIQEIQENISN
jgi:delta11-fatty-acid desaturase